MNLLEDLFSEQFIYSIGWALLHSLWQGALIGLLIAGLMIFMYKYTARLRYFIYLISMFLFTAMVVITFFSAYFTYQPVMPTTSNEIYFTGVNAFTPSEETTTTDESSAVYPIQFLYGMINYFKANIPLFVMIWLLGSLMMMIRFMGGYALVRRYRTQRTKPVLGKWERHFQELAVKVGVQKKVRLLESALVNVPMVIGYLKPVVLIPLGSINGVPAQQMEAILAHELAHIHRRDYVMNLIQSFLEVVFFYHPVFWWLSKNIRMEREHICDDIAITITGNTMEFAKALSNIQEISLGAHSLAAGLSGKSKNQLLNRVRRLTGKPKLHSSFSEGFIAACILVLSLVGMSAAAMITYPANKAVEPELRFNAPELLKTEMPVEESTLMILPDTTDKKKQSVKENQGIKERIIVKSEEELTDEQREKLAEIEKKIQEEMAEVEAKIDAFEAEIDQFNDMKEIEEQMMQHQFNFQKYEKEMQKAAQAYQEAMRGNWEPYVKHGSWTLPELYFSSDSMLIYGDDSLVWNYRLPDNFVPYSDSLHELYFDNWKDHWADLHDVYADIEDHRLEVAEQLKEFQSQDYLRNVKQLEDLRGFVPEPHNVIVAPDPVYFEYDAPMSKTKRIIQNELLEDGLIEKHKEYLVLIGKKQMLINGEKQSRSVFKKYRGIVDSASEPWFIEDNDEFKLYINH